jgi:hypothetical protein
VNTPGNTSPFSFSNTTVPSSYYAEIVAAFTVNPDAPLTDTTGLKIVAEVSGGFLATASCQNPANSPLGGGGFTFKFWLPSTSSYSTVQGLSGSVAYATVLVTSGGTFAIPQNVYSDTSTTPARQFFVVSIRSNTASDGSANCSGLSLRNIQLTALP